MWQVLVAAAIAGGSGYLANKHILHKNDKNHPPVENAEEEASSIFRFSSAANGLMDSPKKSGRKKGKRGKTFGVCLKKRRIGRNALTKCDLVDVKDKSSFGYGVGVGMMYMMSAGKVEINRLNVAVDETAKVVQELKAEISKRKSSGDFERIANHKRVDMKSGQSSFENDNIEVYSFPASYEGEYASSILTDEPHRDVVEMDQLEAELESELLKLQVSTIETSSSSFENKSSTGNFSQPQDSDFEFNESNGIMPFELDQKLSRLLIERQESQIVDLESELQLTNSKLVEKESELQALKDCVKRLTDFSLTCPSDEERDCPVNEVDKKTINGNGRSMAGIKKEIDFD